jgi:DNA topoisomerase-2
MTMKKAEYKLLDEIEHVRTRPGMYCGSTEFTTSNEWVYDPAAKRMVKRNVSYIPAFIKIFSEILDNAIDEHRRAPKVLDQIRVDFDPNGMISVHDNGRGIPVEIHPQTKTYVAETVFSNMRAGSNFNDSEDQQLIGTNGVGSTLTNILSKHFRVESCDGKKLLKQDFFNGMRERGEPKITAHAKNHTKISFLPDYEFFKLDGLNADHVLKMTKKVADAAACNPGVKFYVNGERLDVKNFGDYIKLYADEYVYDDTEDWKVGISESDGFEAVSFVNSVETYQGGTHVWYVMDQITTALREYLVKKFKIEVKPADIRNHMRVYISANVNRPKFSSQTKENMISQPGTYKTSWTAPDAMIKKIIKSNIIQQVLDWAEAKSRAEELAELRKNSKEIAKASPKRVDKFTDAVEKRNRHLCECYFTEGDSARNSIQSARGKNTLIGSFSLRGKPLNVFDAETREILAPRKNGDLSEFANMMVVTGLQFGEKVHSVTQLRFGKFVILSDEDLDGYHISSLLISFWAKYWPELFRLGVIYRMNTPLYIATTSKGDIYEFYTDEEYEAWAKSAPKHKADRYKGLGGFDTETFERLLENRENYLVQVTELEAADAAKLELAFSETEADARKIWLQDIRYFEVEE